MDLISTSQIKVVPLLNNNIDIYLGVSVADGFWQTACELTAGAVTKKTLNIATQLGFPASAGLIVGIMKASVSVLNYRYKHHAWPDLLVTNQIVKESAIFASKTTIAMGAWELGYFVGNLLLTVCAATPFTLWIPAVLAISAGIFQAISAVATQIAEEQHKYGQVKSSKLDLAAAFITNFLGGAAWQLCGYIPFGSTIASAILKPIATTVASILAGLATAAASLIVNKLTPVLFNTTSKLFDSIKNSSSGREEPKVKSSIKQEASSTTKKVSDDKSENTVDPSLDSSNFPYLNKPK